MELQQQMQLEWITLWTNTTESWSTNHLTGRNGSSKDTAYYLGQSSVHFTDGTDRMSWSSNWIKWKSVKKSRGRDICMSFPWCSVFDEMCPLYLKGMSTLKS